MYSAMNLQRFTLTSQVLPPHDILVHVPFSACAMTCQDMPLSPPINVYWSLYKILMCAWLHLSAPVSHLLQSLAHMSNALQPAHK